MCGLSATTVRFFLTIIFTYMNVGDRNIEYSLIFPIGLVVCVHADGWVWVVELLNENKKNGHHEISQTG